MRKKCLLQVIAKHSDMNQRELAEETGYSLGLVNKLISQLIAENYITEELKLLPLAEEEFRRFSPKNAIILAAGYGMRMVPLNTEIPKGLIEINGEPLIERLINQLHEAGICDITVVVGFMKERYEYLIDKYNVKLVVNPQYGRRNNLYSLRLVEDRISNTYIVPCDIWCARNPFQKTELFSWYMVNDLVEDDSTVRVNRKMELVKAEIGTGGNGMPGISYLTEEQAAVVRERLVEYSDILRYQDAFWEETLFNKDRMITYAKVVHFSDVIEINTYEQLREIDSHSNQLNNDAIRIICETFGVSEDKITNISVLKKGMTNRSFLFKCQGKKYIMRIPGEGTDKLIDRRQEASVYEAIQSRKICDEVVYMNPDNGYKITGFIEDARVCDPCNREDVSLCMEKLKAFHNDGYKVEHEFDLFKQIAFYESLWDGSESVYRDYKDTKERVFGLKPYIEQHVTKKTLTHIDAVPDNFLMHDVDGKKEIRIIDWEYAGMQDPHVDIAMFAIYSLYDRQQVDDLIDIYFEDGCDTETRIKIYCYIAVCGLLWSNWCEYKAKFGIEFGEYSLRQYRYAKDYARLVHEELEKL